MQLLQVFHQLRDDLLLVMGADNERKGAFFRKLFRLFHFTEETEPGNYKIINCKEDDDQLEWDHHHIVIKMHLELCTLSFPSIVSRKTERPHRRGSDRVFL